MDIVLIMVGDNGYLYWFQVVLGRDYGFLYNNKEVWNYYFVYIYYDVFLLVESEGVIYK